MLQITWTYTPADFFESEHSVSLGHGTLVLSNGTVTFTTRERASISREAIAGFSELVRSVLDARLVQTGRLYVLSDAQFVEIDDEGRPRYTLFADPGRITLRGQSVDLVITDKSGSIVRDTRKERIAADSENLSRVARMSAANTTLRRMLASFRASFEDAENALIHLYEIRDPAATQFGGESGARSALGMSKADWNRLGELSNATPLEEGRHRGRQSSLRSATPDELCEARNIARGIMDACQHHADDSAV